MENARRDSVRLSYADDDVRVAAKDQRIFVLMAQRAMQACDLTRSPEECLQAFKQGIILPLNRWCKERSTDISACYLMASESTIPIVYMVSANEKIAFDFSVDLFVLTAVIEDAGWIVHILQIPKCSPEELSGIINLGQAIQVFGD